MKFSSLPISLLIALAPKSAAYTRFSDTNSKQAIVVDMDSNRIVYEKNSMTPTAMASLSKMMTLLVTFDALKTRKVSLNDQVSIIASDVNREGTNMKLNNGDVISLDRKSTRLNSSHANISYAVFCLKKKKHTSTRQVALEI